MRDRAREGRRGVHAIRAKRENEGRREPQEGKKGKKDARKRKREAKESAVVKTEEDEITSLSRSATRTENVGRVSVHARSERGRRPTGRGGERAKEEERGNGRVVGRLLGRV